MIWFWWRWVRNYLWTTQHIFMPGFLNALAGLVSTLASVYGAQNGVFSPSSRTTLIVTAATAVINGLLAAFYGGWMVHIVKKRHDKAVGAHAAGKYGTGALARAKRKAKGVHPEAGMI
jgi:hypothetical protein